MILHIKELLKAEGMTAGSLAESIGMTRQSLSNIINGKSFPNEQHIKDIALTLDVPVWRLFVDPDEGIPYIGRDNELHCPYCNRAIQIKALKIA